MRSPRIWLVVGVAILALGVLEVLEGGARAATIAVGAVVTLIAGQRILKDQGDDDRREPPVPPGW